jgi:hypothetical protein
MEIQVMVWSRHTHVTITQEKYENTKWVIRSCNSKDKKYNRQTEKDKQWLKQHCSKTEDLESINRFKPRLDVFCFIAY